METTGSSSRYEQFHSPARVLHTATGCHHAQHTLTADQICHWLHNAKLSQHEFEADRHTPWSCFILENVVWTSSHSFIPYSTVTLYMSLPWGQIKWFELKKYTYTKYHLPQPFWSWILCNSLFKWKSRWNYNSWPLTLQSPTATVGPYVFRTWVLAAEMSAV